MPNNNEPLPFSEVEYTKWDYQEPSKNKSGGRSCFVNPSAGEKRSIWVQVSEFADDPDAMDQHPTVCVTPFGISEPLETAQNKDRRSCELTLETDSQVAFFSGIDRQNVAKAISECEAGKWLADKFPKLDDEIESYVETFKDENDGESPTTEQIEEEKKRIIDGNRRSIKASYTNLVKKAKKKREDGTSYSPTLNAKVDISGDKEVEVWLYKGGGEYEEKTWRSLRRYTRCIPIIEISQMWFANGNFGMSATIRKMIIFPQKGYVPMQKGLNFRLPTGYTKPVVVAGTGDEVEDDTTAVPDDGINPKEESRFAAEDDDGTNGEDE